MSDPIQTAREEYARLTGALVSTGVELHRARVAGDQLAQHHTHHADRLQDAARLRPSAATDEYLEQRRQARHAQAIGSGR